MTHPYRVAQDYMHTRRTTNDIIKYYDSSVPGSYSGINGFIKNNKTSKNAKTWALSQNTITLHKPVRLNFEHRQTFVTEIDQQWQSDLCDIQNLHTDNDGYKFLLVNIDVFFKICNSFPVKKTNPRKP